MTVSLSAGFQAHLQLETTTLATCVEITRTDGTVFRYTDHDDDLEFPTASGTMYIASTGFQRTAVSANSFFALEDVDLTGFFLDSGVPVNDIRRGLFNYAAYHLFAVVWTDNTLGSRTLKSGNFGEVRINPNGQYTFQLHSLSDRMKQKVGSKWGPECRADVGSQRSEKGPEACTIPIDPPLRQNATAYVAGDFVKHPTAAGSDYDRFENIIYECLGDGTTTDPAPTFIPVIGSTTSDGSVSWRAHDAWSRHATVATVSTNQVFTVTVTESRAVDGWFDHGLVKWDTGLNAGLAAEVKGWLQGTSEVTLFIPRPYDVEVGDKLQIFPGCDKRRITCHDKFVMAGSINYVNGNVINMQAEPDVPGLDRILRVGTE